MEKIIKMNEKNVQELKKELQEYDEFWNEKILQDEFENANSEYYVVEKEEKILGFAGLWFNIDEAHIMNIAVKKVYRRHGIGEKLLIHLIQVAKDREKKCITLEVREDNIPAINLYKKENFEVVGRRKKYYNNKIDAIIMTKYF